MKNKYSISLGISTSLCKIAEIISPILFCIYFALSWWVQFTGVSTREDVLWFCNLWFSSYSRSSITISIAWRYSESINWTSRHRITTNCWPLLVGFSIYIRISFCCRTVIRRFGFFIDRWWTKATITRALRSTSSTLYVLLLYFWRFNTPWFVDDVSTFWNMPLSNIWCILPSAVSALYIVIIVGRRRRGQIRKLSSLCLIGF